MERCFWKTSVHIRVFCVTTINVVVIGLVSFSNICTHPFISFILRHAFLVFFCAVCMLHVAQSEDEETDYEMNESD